MCIRDSIYTDLTDSGLDWDKFSGGKLADATVDGHHYGCLLYTSLSLILAQLLNSPDIKGKGIYRTMIFLPCATSLVSYLAIRQGRLLVTTSPQRGAIPQAHHHASYMKDG